MPVARGGHAAFAATMIVLGIWGFAAGDFSAVWQPVPKTLPARVLLAYFCAFIALACGAGLLWQRAAAAAARVLLAFLVLWMLAFRVPVVVHAPTAIVSWENCAETAVIVAGAWVLYASFAAGWDRQRIRFATGVKGVRIARILYGLSVLVFGLAHFAYSNETATLVPGWLPAHLMWTYFTGCTYIAAGVAMLIGFYARLAAAFSALQMGLFTLLVWVPIVAAGGATAFQWSECVISWALTAAGWVVADSYRDNTWLATGKG